MKIIMKLLEDRLDIETITVMIQKEVADRLVTEPGKGDTGAITYAINYYTAPKRVLEVPNTAFVPAPKVNSSVIQLQVLKVPRVKVENETLYLPFEKLLNDEERNYIDERLQEGKIKKLIQPSKIFIKHTEKEVKYLKKL